MPRMNSADIDDRQCLSETVHRALRAAQRRPVPHEWFKTAHCALRLLGAMLRMNSADIDDRKCLSETVHSALRLPGTALRRNLDHLMGTERRPARRRCAPNEFGGHR